MIDKVFGILYQNIGEFISGELIGKSLGVSRAAVSKAIAELKQKGLEIVSIPKNGHKLVSLNDCLDEDIISALTDKKTLFLDDCQSTNLEARKLIETKPIELVVASKQTQGRGRRGRGFVSYEGGIYMTYIIKPQLAPRQAMFINLAAGLSVFDALTQCGFEPFLKYPNDIYINGKKVCGILTEILADFDLLQWAIVGIGINVNNDLPQDLKSKATSLALEKGQKFDRALIIQDVINNFDYYIKQDIVMHYRKKCAMIGKEITIINDASSFAAKAIDLNQDGLLVINRQGKQEVAVGGEVSIKF
ncbi:MAG TPA: biotin--[acetyl-CoA-carboxylase] ligase [Clostridiales bacterium]|nr:biotin--[acetyl-CoA-carboxylase] ligase [Clostridiales bacterium]